MKEGFECLFEHNESIPKVNLRICTSQCPQTYTFMEWRHGLHNSRCAATLVRDCLLLRKFAATFCSSLCKLCLMPRAVYCYVWVILLVLVQLVLLLDLLHKQVLKENSATNCSHLEHTFTHVTISSMCKTLAYLATLHAFSDRQKNYHFKALSRLTFPTFEILEIISKLVKCIQ